MEGSSMISPAHPPSVPWAPSPSPTQSPFSDVISAPPHQSLTPLHQTPSKQPIDFSPPLIAMVVIAAAAFLIVTYSRLISRHFLPPILRQLRRYRRWRRRRRRRLPSSGSATDSPPYTASDLGVYGLDESVIKSMPLSIFSLSHNKNNNFKRDDDEFSLDCAVCLVEFVESEYVRTLPLCTHSFHVDCIDVWLRSHATCPLCRAGILPRDWPFIPVMAARIRPSFEEFDTLFLDPQPESVSEIVEAPIESEARPPQSMMLKRSYSFGFERNFASERLTATASPWRRGSFSFWRRPSPFSSIIKHRVFSFRSTRGMKSPLFGRRRAGRSKSMASPIFGTAPFSSSRMRCGDPEALISPERYAAARGAVD